jgi:hypothetical protein
LTVRHLLSLAEATDPSTTNYNIITAPNPLHNNPTAASVVTLDGEPSLEDTWFPDYAWTIIHCARCHSHVGWKYTHSSVVEEEQQQRQQPQQAEVGEGDNAMQTFLGFFREAMLQYHQEFMNMNINDNENHEEEEEDRDDEEDDDEDEWEDIDEEAEEEEDDEALDIEMEEEGEDEEEEIDEDEEDREAIDEDVDDKEEERKESEMILADADNPPPIIDPAVQTISDSPPSNQPEHNTSSAISTATITAANSDTNHLNISDINAVNSMTAESTTMLDSTIPVDTHQQSPQTTVPATTRVSLLETNSMIIREFW